MRGDPYVCPPPLSGLLRGNETICGRRCLRSQGSRHQMFFDGQGWGVRCKMGARTYVAGPTKSKW